ncbi:M56 family metallopeptidase [Lacrimispora brassicae]
MNSLLLNSLLMKMVSLSVSGSVIAFALLAIRPFIQTKLSRTWQYYIWGIVIMRMMFPFAHEATLINYVFRDGFALINTNEAINSIWLIIAAVLLLKKIISYHIYIRHIKSKCRCITDNSIINLYQRSCREAKVKKPPKLYFSQAVTSPSLIGFCKPCIVLPENMLLSIDDLRFIFLHELAHHKRWDFLYKWLVQIVICLHFFNPAIYIIQKVINRDCEFSCDETVIKRLDKYEKKAYGSALINSLENGMHSNYHAISLMLCDDAKQIKNRLKAIAEHKKMSIVAISLLVILTFSIFSSAVYAGAYRIYPDRCGIHSVKDVVSSWINP